MNLLSSILKVKVPRNFLLHEAKRLYKEFPDEYRVWAELTWKYDTSPVTKMEIFQLKPANTEMSTLDLLNYISSSKHDLNLTNPRGYSHQRQAGQGTYGVVNLYSNQRNNQPNLAIKQMRPNSSDAFAEIAAYALTDLNKCRGILKMKDYDFDTQFCLLGLPAADKDLSDYVQDKINAGTKVQNPDRLAKKLLYALSCLQKCGIINTDIKPKNVLMIKDDPIIADFGVISYHINVNDNVQYTANYRPPEYFLPNPPISSFQGDCWAMAKTIYYIYTGDSDYDRQNPPSYRNRIALIPYIKREFRNSVKDKALADQLVRMID